MTIELLITLDSTTSQEEDVFNNELTAVLPFEIFKIGAICQADSEEVAFVIRDTNSEPHTISLAANTIHVSQDSGEIQGVVGDVKHVIDGFDPIAIDNGLAIDHIGSGATNITFSIFAREIDESSQGISQELYRDLSSELRKVGDPEANVSPGEEFYQIRLKGFKQLGVEK